MTKIYDDIRIITEIPELEGWSLTRGLGIELEERFYRVWDPVDLTKEMRLVRGTGSCGWGWGALLAPPKDSILDKTVSLVYPLVGIAYGVKDKIKWWLNEK